MHQTALAHPEEDRAFLGSFDFTPVFTTKPREIVASLFLDRPRARPMDWGAVGALAAATAITTQAQLAERLAAISSTISQTIVDIAEQVWVLVRAEPADVIGDMRTWIPSPAEPVTPSPAQAALAAVSDIQRWLAVGQDQVAALAGYAPRSVKNWREGMDPYPATVRRLFDLHALLGSLDRAMGTERTRLWLAGTGPAGVSRREHLADDAGLRSVIAEASTTLFEAPTVAPLHALDFEEEGRRDVPPRPDAFSGPVRRMRRRS
ncbi:MAG: hypothetical protein M0005_17375 [Actinomycetota bacterium]|jgi:hypothetical protein|nr:hypothetical protein [Actinomycetota bacterium]